MDIIIFLLHDFPVTDIDIPVTGQMSWLYAMCETKCHVDLSHGGYL